MLPFNNISFPDHANKVLLPRILLTSKDNGRGPCQFTQMQFSVNLAFAMTINKSQGQSLKHVGLDLKSGRCFSHGQLYVGLSRVTNAANLRIVSNAEKPPNEDPLLENVVWKQVLLPASPAASSNEASR